MRALRRLVALTLLVSLSAIAETSSADDLTLRYSIVSAESDGTIVRGIIRVLVQNLTDNDLQNVDLRPFLRGINYIERGLLQFGKVPARDIRFLAGRFSFDPTLFASDQPIVWQVDYDVAGGGHRQDLLVGIKTDG